MRRCTMALFVRCVALGVPAAARAQLPTLHAVLPSWVGMIAAPGRERAATDAIMRASPGWTRGALGTLVRHAGSGSPRRVIACILDRPAYAVSEITADGYLRVHNAEPGRKHALWDQFNEGQRVLVQTRDGTRPGVFATRSTHLWRSRAPSQDLTTVDDLWLDVGARSSSEVAALGISMLDPVVRELPAWTIGTTDNDGYVAGPGSAGRAGCAAVAAMASSAPRTGENIYVIATQGSFGDAGLLGAVARLGRVDEVIVALPAASRDSTAPVRAGTLPARTVASLMKSSARVTGSAMRARFAGTLLETVQLGDVDAFAGSLAAAADVSIDALRPVRLPPPPSAPPTTAVHDNLSGAADLLGRLTDIYGLSGHEAPVRDAVLRELPAWARQKASIDSAGTIVIALGPDRDTDVVVAHMDEIGFEVARLNHDGSVALTARGGSYLSLWEGQPALLHVGNAPAVARVDGACGAASAGPLRGMFVPRDSATRKQPATLTAWFGLDSASMVARGVAPGAAITGYKCATRLGAARFTARSIDDRAGVASLILAIRDLQVARLTHKMIFLFSVREETGLSGALAAAAIFGPTVRRVYAVDTFVSSDSPLESARFAHIPIGTGAVLRALDNSSVTDPAETIRVLALGSAHHIALQVGTTNGGNDGSEFTRLGAMDIPIGWPSRYSHSPVELLDLHDVRSLADIVRTIALAP